MIAPTLQVLWRPRPARRFQKPKSKPTADGAQKSPRGKKRAAPERPKKPEKQADPNSPFAVLKSLSLGTDSAKKANK